MPKANKKENNNRTARHFTFTDYDVSEEHQLELLGWDKKRYIIVGQEICPTTDRPHLQCYAQFPNAIRFSAVKKIAPEAHIEESKGSDQENYEYCSKDCKFREAGKRVKQGVRVDIEEIKEQVLEGKQLDEVCRNTCNLQQLRFAESLYKYMPLQYREPPQVIWLYGPAGIGKTRTVYDNHELNEIYESGRDGQWFDGYYGQRVAILDEFREGWCQFSYFLKLIDRYPMRVPVKGGFVPWKPEIIYITSPKHPKETFTNHGDEDIQQVLRRITRIEHFDEM